MPKIIEKSISYELNASINSIGSIIKYEKEFNKIIKFNAANQYATELFKKNMIKYIHMPKIIEKSISYELKASINSIGSIIKYEKEFNKIMISNYEKA